MVVAIGVLVVAESSSAAFATQHFSWMPSIGINFSLRLDGLASLFAFLVLGIGAIVLCYSSRYLIPGSHTSFFVLMTTFAAAMLTLVLANDLVVMFVAWEITTLCSFFLISRSGSHAREPAIRTLLVTVTGGLCLLSAVVVIAVETGTTHLGEVFAHPAWHDNSTFTLVVAILLAVAAFTKSAQFPFQFWLPDSMVAITPVSAYLHAATMVKAGIYLLLRFSPVLNDVAAWNVLLISSGIGTALLGAFGAIRQDDLKGLLAYSTVSQLGLIVALIGVGTSPAITAAILFTVGHALFKAALFMLVGVVDRKTGTRSIAGLVEMQLRMPLTKVAIGVAAASMAGIPPLLGFISKESMFGALIEAPGPDWVAPAVAILAVVASIMTFVYSGRMVLGVLGSRKGPVVLEAPFNFLIGPVICAVAGLLWGLVPFMLDPVISAAASSATGENIVVHLSLWHGINTPLVMSSIVVILGAALLTQRSRIEGAFRSVEFPVSGVGVVDNLRSAVIQFGGRIGALAGTTDPRRHLAIPVVCVMTIAMIGLFAVDTLPAQVGSPSRTRDWVLVALIAAGVIAAVTARTRISAIVVTGVTGFTMTVWFVNLGAADVAMTQLLVEILTVGVMVLVLQRLPARFSSKPAPKNFLPVALSISAGAATTIGVWAFTGRRGPSEVADYFLREGENTTGGANIVNTILVDFRALDTLGEVTVLGVAGVAIAALLSSRQLIPVVPANIRSSSPIASAKENSIFLTTVTRGIIPLLILLSLLLLLRGHQEPGGGFIAALISGAAFILVYLAAPSDDDARIRWPYLAMIGIGVMVGAGTGFLGYLQGSFLAPLYVDIAGVKITSALVFDLGVYLGVIGILLSTLNLLGRHRLSGTSGDPSVTLQAQENGGPR